MSCCFKVCVFSRYLLSFLTCSLPTQCLNLTQLLTYYGLQPDSVISQSEFIYLCPALLYQIDSRVCIRHYHQVDVEQEALETVSSGEKPNIYPVCNVKESYVCFFIYSSFI